MTDLTASERIGSRDSRMSTAAVHVAWCAVLALAPFLWRVGSGTRRLPNDDTWAYERIFQTFYDTGRIVLIDWNDISLVGMLPITRAWVAVLGNGPLQIHLLGSVMAFVALLALRSILSSLRSSMVLLTLTSFGVFSGFVVTSGSFMADQFALAGSLVAVAIAVHLATHDRPAHVEHLLAVGAAFATIWAFSVRQQSATAAVVVFTIILVAGTRGRRAWATFAAVYLVVALPFYLWRATLENGGDINIVLNSRLIVAGWVVMGLSLCVAMVPIVLAKDFRSATGSGVVRVIVSVLAVAGSLLFDPGGHVNDYLSILQRLAQAEPLLRTVATVVLANVVLTVWWGARRRRVDLGSPLLVALAAGTVLALAADVVSVVVGSDYYSRYSLFSLALVLVVYNTSRPVAEVDERSGYGWAAVACVAMTSYFALDTGLVSTRAAQEAARIAECAGIPAERLDAGIVWMGTHSTGVVVAKHQDEPWTDDGLPRTQHQRIFPSAVRHAVLLENPPNLAHEWGIAGPIEASGVLPTNRSSMWLVVRSADAEALSSCFDE